LNISHKNKRSAVVAYIDYSKAFDCVNRKKRFINLSAYGVTRNLFQWMDSVLSNRTQQTRIAASLSDMICLARGIVQGSVIGLLTFLLFINDARDLLCCDRCTCKLYANDVKVHTTLCYMLYTLGLLLVSVKLKDMHCF